MRGTGRRERPMVSSVTMLRSSFVRAACLLTLAASLPMRAAAQDGKAVVTVYAAASLREALEAAGPAFTKRTGFPVRFVFGGSDMLATQLIEGAPADVFASANAAQTARVAALTGTPRRLARNRLVVIAAADGPVRALRDLAKPGVRVVLAAPSVPVGAYGREALRALARDLRYGADFDTRVAARVVSQETDVKAVAAKVALGEGDAGIVYATDVTPAIVRRVRVLAFPRGIAPEAVYPIAALKAAPNAAGAQAFLRFITSARGAAYLRARGYLP